MQLIYMLSISSRIAFEYFQMFPNVLQGRGLTGHCGNPCPQSVGARKANLSPEVEVRLWTCVMQGAHEKPLMH